MDEKEIAAGKAVEQFLESEAIKGAFEKLHGLYYSQFQSAEPDKAVALQGRSRALSDIQNEMRIIVDNGKLAERNRDQRQKAEQSRSR